MGSEMCIRDSHWASTETSAVNPGHIDGALARAETIAARILERGTE